MRYLTIFKTSIEEEIAYPISFLLWRFRNILHIFLIFFLWDSIYSGGNEVYFGYSREKILTYVFGVLVLRAVVLSSKSNEIAGEISRGDIMNFLLKPFGYFRYWFIRDVASKVLNLAFTVPETIILFLLLKPPFYVQGNPQIIFYFLIAVALAAVLFFYLILIVDMITFWVPEAGWAGQYLFIMIFTEFLSGVTFPLDILPSALQRVIYILPFPYLLFFPLEVYLGKLSVDAVFAGFGVVIAWLLVLHFTVRYVWGRGIKQYVAFGK